MAFSFSSPAESPVCVLPVVVLRYGLLLARVCVRDNLGLTRDLIALLYVCVELCVGVGVGSYEKLS